MVEIRIDNTGDGTWWLYNDNNVWKDYCGCDNFDEQVVLTGNRHCKEYKDAEWYQKTKEVIEDIDCYELYPEYTSEEVNAKLKELYDKCRCTEDIMIDVLRLLYPEDALKTERLEVIVKVIGKITLSREMWIRIYLKQCILERFLILP